MKKSTYKVKVGLAEMLKGGVIMDVTNAEQAKIAEQAGAVAVMALERIPADIPQQANAAYYFCIAACAAHSFGARCHHGYQQCRFHRIRF